MIRERKIGRGVYYVKKQVGIALLMVVSVAAWGVHQKKQMKLQIYKVHFNQL